MRTVSLADKTTGMFTGVKVMGSDDATIEQNVPAGQRAVDGLHDHRNRRYDEATDSVVPYQPPQPSADHMWNEESEEWRLTPEAEARITDRREARRSLEELDASQGRAVTEHILGIPPDPGQPTAAERLAAIHAAKVELRKKLQE